MPGGAFRMNGSRQSYQVIRMMSSSDSMVSTVVERGSPSRVKTAGRTGTDSSANGAWSRVSMVRCSQRATEMSSA